MWRINTINFEIIIICEFKMENTIFRVSSTFTVSFRDINCHEKWLGQLYSCYLKFTNFTMYLNIQCTSKLWFTHLGSFLNGIDPLPPAISVVALIASTFDVFYSFGIQKMFNVRKIQLCWWIFSKISIIHKYTLFHLKCIIL